MNYPKFWEGKGNGICEIQKFQTYFLGMENNELVKK